MHTYISERRCDQQRDGNVHAVCPFTARNVTFSLDTQSDGGRARTITCLQTISNW